MRPPVTQDPRADLDHNGPAILTKQAPRLTRRGRRRQVQGRIALCNQVRGRPAEQLLAVPSQQTAKLRVHIDTFTAAIEDTNAVASLLHEHAVVAFLHPQRLLGLFPERDIGRHGAQSVRRTLVVEERKLHREESIEAGHGRNGFFELSRFQGIHYAGFARAHGAGDIEREQVLVAEPQNLFLGPAEQPFERAIDQQVAGGSVLQRDQRRTVIENGREAPLARGQIRRDLVTFVDLSLQFGGALNDFLIQACLFVRQG